MSNLSQRSCHCVCSMIRYMHRYEYKPYRGAECVPEVFSSHPNLRALVYLGSCWFPAFITICVSLGVRCSAPPPGGTSTNENTTSNEHPPPSVLNYSAVPLPELRVAAKSQLKHKRHGSPRPREPKNSSRVSMSDALPRHVCRV